MRSKRLVIFMFMVGMSAVAAAEEKSASDKIISDAVTTMEKKRDELKDPLHRAKVDKAIRSLKEVLEESESEPGSAKVADFNVDDLKRKFSGRVVYDSKVGELTLKYDFSGKPQLSDFDVGKKRVLINKKMLLVEAGDSLNHIAKFKTLTVTATMNCTRLKNVGIGSSTGAGLGAGGAGFDTIYLSCGSGRSAEKIVPDNLRKGSIPVVINFMPQKVSVKFGNEVLTVPGTNKNESHQAVFHGGGEGCGFSNLSIVGVPDEEWLKTFLASP